MPYRLAVLPNESSRMSKKLGTLLCLLIAIVSGGWVAMEAKNAYALRNDSMTVSGTVMELLSHEDLEGHFISTRILIFLPALACFGWA